MDEVTRTLDGESARVERDDGVRAGALVAGRYRLGGPIGSGGVASVWRATDERLGRAVAVKLLSPDADPAFRERFTDEARRAAAISHPNVVTVYDAGTDGDRSYIVMELVDGRPLDEVIRERGPLPPHRAARIVTQIASALDAAHARGLVHCDVKPANVLVTDGSAKLADFGIARAAAEVDRRELVGTPRYVSPEQVRGDAPTPRSDIYALGLVAYEMLTGRPAFDAAGSGELLRARLAGPAPAALVDPRTDATVQRALARDPARRYATAGEFAAAFAAAVGAMDRTQPLAVPLAPPPAAAPLPRGAIATLLALALVALGLVAFFRTYGGAAVQGAAPSPSAAHVTPRVIGMSYTQAGTVLCDAGFRCPIPYLTDANAKAAPGTVVSQDPPPDSPYQPGQAARITIAPIRSGEGKGND